MLLILLFSNSIRSSNKNNCIFRHFESHRNTFSIFLSSSSHIFSKAVSVVVHSRDSSCSSAALRRRCRRYQTCPSWPCWWCTCSPLCSAIWRFMVRYTHSSHTQLQRSSIITHYTLSVCLCVDHVEAELLHTFTKVYKFDTMLLLVRLAVLTAVTLTVPIVLFPVSNSTHNMLSFILIHFEVCLMPCVFVFMSSMFCIHVLLYSCPPEGAALLRLLVLAAFCYH